MEDRIDATSRGVDAMERAEIKSMEGQWKEDGGEKVLRRRSEEGLGRKWARDSLPWHTQPVSARLLRLQLPHNYSLLALQ